MTYTTIKTFCLFAAALILSACHGVFDGYDDPEVKVQTTEGQFYVEASNWQKWYYIDLKAVNEEVTKNPKYDASSAIVERDIPMTPTGEQEPTTGHHRPGQYMYWFDAWGQGLTVNEFRYYTPTASQPDPASWTLAFHRDNVRTNGCAVHETTLTSMDQLPPSSSVYAGEKFTEDTWSENQVWTDQSQMLTCLVPSQGIAINRLLSSWLIMSLPPIPPKFTHNNHVFILRLSDGSYGALQLENYISPGGTKCCLTINYKYPF